MFSSSLRVFALSDDTAAAAAAAAESDANKAALMAFSNVKARPTKPSRSATPVQGTQADGPGGSGGGAAAEDGGPAAAAAE
jgi:hypothetical protein